MKTTAAVLRELQDYYDSLPSRPTIKEVAHHARLPVATTARFLNGTNKAGAPDRIRALCIALDRHDLAEALPQNPSFNSVNDVMVLYRESEKESRESNLEELERVRTMYEKSEARWEKIVSDKDEHIRQLVSRIAKLEENNGKLSAAHTHAERRRTKYEVVALILLVALGLYFIIFDLPHPDYGISEALVKLVEKIFK